jgi:hypothetical protein
VPTQYPVSATIKPPPKTKLSTRRYLDLSDDTRADSIHLTVEELKEAQMDDRELGSVYDNSSPVFEGEILGMVDLQGNFSPIFPIDLNPTESYAVLQNSPLSFTDSPGRGDAPILRRKVSGLLKNSQLHSRISTVDSNISPYKALSCTATEGFPQALQLEEIISEQGSCPHRERCDIQ